MQKKLILSVLIALTVAFIFTQSLLNQDMSNQESTAVKEQIVDPIKEAVPGTSKTEISTEEVRNMAHVAEFLILGIEIVLLLENRKPFLRVLKTVSYCGFVAFVDESIQYVTDRGPEVSDIWKDILGAAIGAVIGLFVVALIRRTKKLTEEGRYQS